VTLVNTYTPLATSGVVAVSGSSPVPVCLVVYMVSGGGAATAYTVYANVAVQTVPFGNTGAGTLSSEVEPASDGPLTLPVGD
jgi:hypothetical protein